MHDRVADVLRQRATLERGAGPALALSLALHGGLIAIAAWAALHSVPPQPVSMINIRLAQPMTQPAATAPPAIVKATPKTVQPKPIEQPKLANEPTVAEPAPVTTKAPEKNTVPLSPFGQSARKGSENPATAKPAAPAVPAATAGVTGTAPDVAIGTSGVTGLEGGDFPYTLYLEGMQRKIGSNWFRSPNTPPGTTTVVYFRIQRDGTITNVDTPVASKNETFNRAAKSAVLSSSPLNPLPFNYSGQYLGVHLTFR